MSHVIPRRIARLAERLGDLRRQLKEAARFEVAQAIADALAEAARTWIAGRTVPAARPSEDDWDDPWNDDPHSSTWNARDVPRTAKGPNRTPPRYEAAVAGGLVAARWTFVRTRHPLVAIAAAAAVAIAILCTGDRFHPLIDVITTAQDLLTFPR